MSPDVPATSTPTKRADDAKQILLITKDNTSSWYYRGIAGAKMFEADTGIQVIAVGPEESVAEMQEKVILGGVEDKVDAICLYPVDAAALAPALAKVREANIPVYSYEAIALQNTSYNLEPFHPEDYGSEVMSTLAEQMGGVGSYCVMVPSKSNFTHNQWADCAIAYQKEEYPMMSLLEGLDGWIESEDNVGRAYEKAKEIIRKNPKLKGFLCTSANELEGVCKAVDYLGRGGHIAITGTGMPSSAKKFLERNILQSFYTWDPAQSVYALLTLAKTDMQQQDPVEISNLEAEGYRHVKPDQTDIIIQRLIQFNYPFKYSV